MAPDGWEKRTLASLADYHNGRAFKPKDWGEEGLPIIRITQMTNPIAKTDFYSGDDVEAKHKINNGDMLFSWSATLTVMLWNRGAAALNQHIFKVEEKPGINSDFLYHLLSNSIDALAEHSHGSTMKHIKKGVLKDFIVSVPSLHEQNKIAAILSNVDDTIQATQAVIDQTHKVKQGLMQQFFTRGIGHTQFKQTEIGEIPEEWDVVRLGEVFSNRKEPGISDIPVMSVTMNDGLVERHTLNRRVVSELLPEKHLRAHKGDLVYNMMRMWQGASGVAWDDCIVSPAYVLCKPSDLILPRFIAQFFKAPAIIRKLHQHSQGITEDRLRLYFHHFAEIVIGLPPKIEQEQISDTLESIDNDVISLKNELNSLQRIKKATMQDLLTGRVRVKLDEVNTT